MAFETTRLIRDVILVQHGLLKRCSDLKDVSDFGDYIRVTVCKTEFYVYLGDRFENLWDVRFHWKKLLNFLLWKLLIRLTNLFKEPYSTHHSAVRLVPKALTNLFVHWHLKGLQSFHTSLFNRVLIVYGHGLKNEEYSPKMFFMFMRKLFYTWSDQKFGAISQFQLVSKWPVSLHTCY